MRNSVNEDKSINVAGIWYSKPDLLSFNLSELNFSKKQWGTKKENLNSFLPGKFTRLIVLRMQQKCLICWGDLPLLLQVLN